LTLELLFYIIPPMLATDSTFFPSQTLAPAPGRDAPSLYRQYFTKTECRLIDSTPLTSALSEISLIRIMLLRILAAAYRSRKIALEQHLAMLQAFSQAGLVLASLARYHHHRFSLNHSLLDALDELDPDDL
jgi:hypothetical protein